MKKMLIASLLLLSAISFADICGVFSKSSGRYYMEINGSGNVQVLLPTGWIFKGQREAMELAARDEANVCLSGEFLNDYLFEAMSIYK